MKVLFFANTAWYLYNFRLPLAQYLRERGCEVVMVSPPDNHAARIEAAGFRWIALPFERRSLNPLREAKVLRDVIAVYRAERPDVVHHFTIKCVIYGSLAARFCGIRNRVNAVVGMGYVFSSTDLRARLLRPLVRGLLTLLAGGKRGRVIVQNPDDFAALAAGSLAPERSLRLIRGSGVDTHRFQPHGRTPAAVTRVLLASRLVTSKGVSDYVEAARSLRREGAAVEFLLAGEPDPGNPGEIPVSQVQQWDAEGAIRYLGHVADMPALMREVDVAVLPTHGGEGVPRGLVEAAAAGLPIITTNVPGCREIVEPGVNGLLIAPRNPAALAEALRLMTSEPGLRLRMGQAGRAKVLAEFDQAIVHERTLEVYRELVGDRLGPRAGAPVAGA